MDPTLTQLLQTLFQSGQKIAELEAQVTQLTAALKEQGQPPTDNPHLT